MGGTDGKTEEEVASVLDRGSQRAPAYSIEQALLAYEDGEGTNGEIASKTGMSTVALANLVNKCISFGPMVALNDLPRSGRKSILYVISSFITEM